MIRSAVFLVVLMFAAAAQGQLYAGARLIPGDGGPTIERAEFLVEKGRITQVGRAGEVKAPAGVARVDLTGKTVMPTLISTHVHPGFQKGLTYSAENYTRETILNDLNLALYYGVSVVMSQGIERGDLAIQMRGEQLAGKLGGALLLVAGRGIGAPNAGPGALAYKGIAHEVTTEEQIRQAVRAEAARKVNAIKIWVDDRGGRAPSLSPELAVAAADEARKHKLRISAHVYYHRDAVGLAAAKVDSFAHLVRDSVMEESLLVAVIRNRLFVMPNMGGGERNTHTSTPPWFEEPYLAGLLKDTVPPEVIERMKGLWAPRDPAVVERVRGIYRNVHRNTSRLKDAGARVILGSDTGLPDHFFGYAEQRELELMHSAGMTTMEVIVAATSRAAEYLQLPDRGVLEAGRRADFLVLDGNPLDDIRNTRRIARTFINGVEIDRAALKAALIK
jgi:imidazolonepropionase-like amidohydrolase